MSCENLPLGSRRALAMRVFAAIEVESNPSLLRDHAPTLQQRKSFVKFLRTQSDRFGGQDDSRVPELRELVEREIREWSFPTGCVALEHFEGARQRMLARVAERSCPGCGGQTNVRCDDGPCIFELVELGRHVETHVRGLYGAHTLGDADVPVSLIVEVADDGSDIGCLRQFHVNGYTDVLGQGGGAIVGLEIEECQLDWAALCRCLYVLMHEYACHALQATDTQDRRNADVVCSWSDGWMDALAWSELVRWIDVSTRTLPAWLRRDPETLKKHCLVMHERHYEDGQGPTMTTPRLQRRTNARRSFQTLERLYAGRRGESRSAATRFSVRFNADAIGRDERDAICALLETGLYLDPELETDRLKCIAKHCEAYSSSRDAGRLADNLRRTIGPERALRSLMKP